MDDQNSILEEGILELQDPTTTPEKALHLFSSPCFSLCNYKIGDNEPIVIFLAYIRFIIAKQPDAFVEGIWEEIVRNTIMYKRNYSVSQIQTVRMAEYQKDFDRNVYPRSWLVKALSNPGKCPNPYIRLELFCMVRLFLTSFGGETKTTCENICTTLMCTISEIQPYRLYPIGDKDACAFDICDFIYVINSCNFLHKMLMHINSTDITEAREKKNEAFLDRIETKFLCHCVQILGMRTVITGTIPEFYNEDNDIPWVELWVLFKDILSHPPFCYYTIESICDIMTVVAGTLNNNTLCQYGRFLKPLLFLRNVNIGNLDVPHKSCDLPRLLLSRQVQGFTRVSQRSLLIPVLHPLKENMLLNGGIIESEVRYSSEDSDSSNSEREYSYRYIDYLNNLNDDSSDSDNWS